MWNLSGELSGEKSSQWKIEVRSGPFVIVAYSFNGEVIETMYTPEEADDVLRREWSSKTWRVGEVTCTAHRQAIYTGDAPWKQNWRIGDEREAISEIMGDAFLAAEDKRNLVNSEVIRL